MSALTTDPAPASTVQAGIVAGSGSHYVEGFATGAGIASVSEPPDGAYADIVLSFRSPASLGPGTCHDSLTVEGCYDKACTEQGLQHMPLSGLSAGDGLLGVPAGTKVIAYTLSTNP